MHLRPRHRVLTGLAAAALLAPLAGLSATTATAATADQAVVLPAVPGTQRITYTDTAPFNNGQANLLLDDVTGACDPASSTGARLRSTHTVDLQIPTVPSPALDILVRFQIDWTPAAGAEAVQDLRMDLFGPDNKLVASSDGSQTSEGINVTSATPGTYTMIVCAFQTTPNGQAFTGSVTASVLAPPATNRRELVNAPTYTQFSAPKGQADNAGEPSIGSNWKSGKTLFTSNTSEYVVTFDDAAGTSSWVRANTQTADPSNKISLDPIGYTDSVTGRTFVSQLYLACSASAYTDDDFATQVIPSQGCGSGINGFDHQTFGGGPFAPGGVPATVYPRAVYYCSQAQALALGGSTCARSDDGGVTFGPPVEIFGGKCNGIHGHVRVSPLDGTVYVPDDNCAGKQGVAVSSDNGLTWAVRTLPDSNAGTSDPSVSVGSDGTVYFGYSDGTGRAKVAVSRNKGLTWTPSTDAGGQKGVRNAEFAEVVAGDGNRAAFAFLGTSTPGSTQPASFGKDAAGTTFTGAEWHLYVATTFDRGATWTTTDATPTDPVQRGCVWNAGGSNPCRNLLDFNDITVDKTGHVMVGYADGCVDDTVVAGSSCVSSTAVAANKLTKHGTILRQSAGPGLFAAFDLANGVGPDPVVPEAPVAALLPLAGLAMGAVFLLRRRRVAQRG